MKSLILREASPAARSAANGVLSGAKVRVKIYSSAHVSREVSAAPANSGTAVLMVAVFSRQSFVVMPNSATKKSQIATRSSFEVKTGRVPHLDPIGSACDPLPRPERARGVNFGRTEEGDSSRPQPVPLCVFYM